MTILFGHPSGNPNSHHAALAHFETGRLEAFCVPWMPSAATLQLLQRIEPLRPMAQRLARRHFPPLANAPKIQGRAGELRRLVIRALGRGDEALSYEANDWLMSTMAKASRRSGVTAVHAYEDCSLLQFAEARRSGKACIYDMPIGYHSAWLETEQELVRKFADWLPAQGQPSHRYVRPEQKRQEMELADIVLAPSSFVERTIGRFHPGKKVARARYGVDCDFWSPGPEKRRDGILRFIYAGQLSLRKGIPDLVGAWEKAGLRDATLDLVGSWLLSEERRRALPRTILHTPPCAPETLRDRFRAADVFLFPSYFEGFGLAMIEALACGLPAIASEATAGPDILDNSCGRSMIAGDIDTLVESLRWFGEHRDLLPAMSLAARARAETLTWPLYRRQLADAVSPFV